MILGFELTVFCYIALAAVFRLTLKLGYVTALALLTLSSSLLLFAVNPVLAAYLLLQVAWVLALYWLCVRYPAFANRIAWLSFLGLLPLNLEIWLGGSEQFGSFFSRMDLVGLEQVFWSTGAAFFVVKSFVGLKEAIKSKKLHLLPLLAGLTFLPSFPAGPIFGSAPFRRENVKALLDPSELVKCTFLMGWGAAAFYILAPALRNVAASNGDSLLGTVADIYLNFAALFLDFSGYTIMALSVASYFGFKLPENFNRPYLATSIQKFWQRWHMSLSKFISQYLFKPFVRSTGSPRKGIFLAFVFVGLWHEITVGYFLWGIGHGIAMSMAMKPPALWHWMIRALPSTLQSLIGWFLTMTWVSILSYLANIEVSKIL
ncbi:MAG: MBOAT family O-acyltransferase [Pseudomonadota bacterium]